MAIAPDTFSPLFSSTSVRASSQQWMDSFCCMNLTWSKGCWTRWLTKSWPNLPPEGCGFCAWARSWHCWMQFTCPWWKPIATPTPSTRFTWAQPCFWPLTIAWCWHLSSYLEASLDQETDWTQSKWWQSWSTLPGRRGNGLLSQGSWIATLSTASSASLANILPKLDLNRGCAVGNFDWHVSSAGKGAGCRRVKPQNQWLMVILMYCGSMQFHAVPYFVSLFENIRNNYSSHFCGVLYPILRLTYIVAHSSRLCCALFLLVVSICNPIMLHVAQLRCRSWSHAETPCRQFSVLLQ